MTGKPSRRLVIVGPASPYRGGIAQFTDATAAGLRRRGHEVEVVTFTRQYPKLLFPGTSQLEPAMGDFEGPADAGDSGLRLEAGDSRLRLDAGHSGEASHAGAVGSGSATGAVGSGSAAGAVGSGSGAVGSGSAAGGVGSGSDAPAKRMIDSMNPVTWIRTAGYIAGRAPDAVLFQYWMPFFAPGFGTIARMLKRSAKVVAVVHNAIPHERRPGDIPLGKFFFRQCAGFLALSDAVAQDLRSLDVRGEIRTAAHPVYEHFGPVRSRRDARMRLGIPEEDEVLLFFGFIRRYKGLDTLLEAMPAIVQARPRARLVIAGEFYEDEARYRSAMRRLGIDQRILIHPEYIPAEDVADYFSAANLVVQPYASATQSGVVQTAYHFERPVVVTDVGGLAEVVPDGRAGFVVPPADPDALAQAVIRFFREDLEAPFAEAVKIERERYSWGSLLDAIEELIDAPTDA